MDFVFKNKDLLRQALVHSSYLNENPDLGLPSNEALEFLGDAILGFVVASRLYLDCPGFSEGQLTTARASVVAGKTLAKAAARLELGKHLYMGHGTEVAGGRDRERILAGALEALAGAVFLDSGLDAAERFILGTLGKEIKRAEAKDYQKDFKSRLQEEVQGKWRVTPEYIGVESAGGEYAWEFTVEVLAKDRVLGRGSGKTKREAEMEAAKAALENLEGRSPEISDWPL
ncbi:MAG: ribonuclease III [Chloroflexi bacterium]|nr:ribonuclease III [Chloroflexota bacterium]